MKRENSSVLILASVSLGLALGCTPRPVEPADATETETSESGETGSETGDEAPWCAEELLFQGFVDPRSAQPCSIAVAEQSEWLEYVSVTLNDEDLPNFYDPDLNCAVDDFWAWETEYSVIQLCGASCESFVAEGGYVEVIRGCPHGTGD